MKPKMPAMMPTAKMRKFGMEPGSVTMEAPVVAVLSGVVIGEL